MPDASTVSRGRLTRLVVIGLVAGAFSTLFGVGGGIVVVPLLIWLLREDAKAATATSLAAIVITAAVGAASHAVLGNVEVDKALAIGLPAVAGVLIGVALKARLSSAVLTMMFAVFLLGIAVRMLFPGGHALDDLSAGVEVPLVIGIGVLTGVVAGLFGVGGGTLFVPALVLILGVSQLHAVGTSLLAMIPLSVLGTWRQHRSGTVRLHDAGVIGSSSAVTAAVGALVADHTPGAVLRVLFAVVMIATAAQLALRARASSP